MAVRRRAAHGAAVLAVAVLFVATQVPSRAEPPTPASVVERLHEALIASMREGPALGFEGRWETLNPVVREVFDLPRMMRLIIGTPWDSYTDEQRGALVQAFGDWTSANYASQFASLDGEQFVTLETVDAPRATKIVKTHLLPAREDPVVLDYRLSSRSGSWQIIDIYLDGRISELARRRSEFAGILAKEGVDGLIERLNQKIANLSGRS